jgi:hypothetical protein
MTEYLCKNLRLDIQREDSEDQQIRITLRSDLQLKEVEICYQVTQREDGAQRRYYLQEAMVIAMRRLVGVAIEGGLISDSPGASTSSKSGITKPAAPFTTFRTDEESL